MNEDEWREKAIPMALADYIFYSDHHCDIR